MGQNGQRKTNHLSGAQRVCHEHFEESCFEAELQTRLGFRRFKHPKPGAVPTVFNFDPTTREKRKGPEVLKKDGNICYIKLLEDNFSLKGTIKMAKKGREIKVHFTFVMDKFASAKPLNLLIIYSIPSTSESYNSSFWLFV